MENISAVYYLRCTLITPSPKTTIYIHYQWEFSITVFFSTDHVFQIYFIILHFYNFTLTIYICHLFIRILPLQIGKFPFNCGKMFLQHPDGQLTSLSLNTHCKNPVPSLSTTNMRFFPARQGHQKSFEK